MKQGNQHQGCLQVDLIVYMHCALLTSSLTAHPNPYLYNYLRVKVNKENATRRYETTDVLELLLLAMHRSIEDNKIAIQLNTNTPIKVKYLSVHMHMYKLKSPITPEQMSYTKVIPVGHH